MGLQLQKGRAHLKDSPVLTFPFHGVRAHMACSFAPLWSREAFWKRRGGGRRAPTKAFHRCTNRRAHGPRCVNGSILPTLLNDVGLALLKRRLPSHIKLFEPMYHQASFRSFFFPESSTSICLCHAQTQLLRCNEALLLIQLFQSDMLPLFLSPSLPPLSFCFIFFVFHVE